MTIKYILKKKSAADVFPAVNCRLFGVYVTQKNTFYIDHSIINDCADRRKIKRTQT